MRFDDAEREWEIRNMNPPEDPIEELRIWADGATTDQLIDALTEIVEYDGKRSRKMEAAERFLREELQWRIRHDATGV